MAALTIPTFGDVRLVKRGGVSRQHVDLGDFERAYSGKLRSDGVKTARVWPLQTEEYENADVNSIIASLTATPPISVSGDVMGGTVLVHPKNIQTTFSDDNGGLTGFVSFELHAQALV